jgi:hypothetical protein
MTKLFSAWIRVSEFVKRPNLSTLFLFCSLAILSVSSTICLIRLAEKEKAEKILTQQLTATVFDLSRERRSVAIAKEKQESIQRQLRQEAERTTMYFNDVPLVISTLDGKGRLVGFSRLGDSNGTAQYSFIIKNGSDAVTVTGTITNQSGKFIYSDDYSTPMEFRTSGEVVHGKPNSTRLRLDFVVTSTPSEKYRVGDTFFATFVLPGVGGEAT